MKCESPSGLDQVNQSWSPTAFGNRIARDVVFRLAHEQQKLSTIPLLSESVAEAQSTVAIAAILVAIHGDFSLLNECGAAFEFCGDEYARERIRDVVRLEELVQKLREIRSESRLMAFWRQKEQHDAFDAVLEHLLEQLTHFPKCKKTKFKKMSKRELLNHLQRCGVNWFATNSEWLMLSQICAQEVIDLGRYRGVRSVSFMPCTDVDHQHVFDDVIRYALQNWGNSIRCVDFKRMGTLRGKTTCFEFPSDICRYLGAMNLRTFEAANFITTDQILQPALGPELGSISLGPNHLTASIFDEVERVCVSLKNFFIDANFPCEEKFLRRAEIFKLRRPEVHVQVGGQLFR